MNEHQLKFWLRLSRLELSPRAVRALLEKFGSPEAIFNSSEDELKTINELTNQGRGKILGPVPVALERDLKLIDEMKISAIPILSDDYPVRLKEIYDPPALIYVRGDLLETDKFALGIVGSRRASVYGRSVAESISRNLAVRGLTIVSGGARGIDTAAHKGALTASGRTIAVLGCGVDVAYPAENKKLYETIAESGAVISEFPLGSAPEPWRFPPRNRLISGLSIGVLVCQCPTASGALITASYAAEQGRDVYAVPGNVDDDRNAGCHSLIKDGAKLVENADDILVELGLTTTEEENKVQLSLPMDSLNDQEKKIVSVLSLEAMQVDEIIEKCQMPAHMVSGTLTILEMKNIIKRVPGNAYVRVL